MSPKLTKLDFAATELFVYLAFNRSNVVEMMGVVLNVRQNRHRGVMRKADREKTSSRRQILPDSAVDAAFSQCQLRKLLGNA